MNANVCGCRFCKSTFANQTTLPNCLLLLCMLILPFCPLCNWVASNGPCKPWLSGAMKESRDGGLSSPTGPTVKCNLSRGFASPCLNQTTAWMEIKSATIKTFSLCHFSIQKSRSRKLTKKPWMHDICAETMANKDNKRQKKKRFKAAQSKMRE